jgi:hypothetical protein
MHLGLIEPLPLWAIGRDSWLAFVDRRQDFDTCHESIAGAIPDFNSGDLDFNGWHQGQGERSRSHQEIALRWGKRRLWRRGFLAQDFDIQVENADLAFGICVLHQIDLQPHV